MKRIIKKYGLIFFAATLLMAWLPDAVCYVSAEETHVTQDGYVFEYVDGSDYGNQDAVSIVEYIGSNKDIVIPSVLNTNGKDYPVYFKTVGNNSDIKSVKFEAGVKIDPESVDMFKDAKQLVSVDFTNADFSKARSLENLFWNCKNLTSVNFAGINTESAKNMEGMFWSCKKLKSVDVSALDTGNVTSMESMFDNCTHLESINVNGFDTKSVTTMEAMFEGCGALTSLDLSSFNTSSLNNLKYTFNDCSHLTQLNLTGWNMSKVRYLMFTFAGCEKLTSIDLSGYGISSNLVSMADMFSECTALKDVNLSNIDTSSVYSMVYMFAGCKSLTTVDLSGFNTAKLIDMKGMFKGCSGLTKLTLNNFYTGGVGSMIMLFKNCSALKYLDIHNFDMSNVKTINGMFEGAFAKDAIVLLPEGYDFGKLDINQSLAVKTTTRKVSFKKLKRKAQTFYIQTASKAGKGIQFKKISGDKKIKVSKDGKVTLRKGLRKKNYRIKVKATAAGNDMYKKITINKMITIKVK